MVATGLAVAMGVAAATSAGTSIYAAKKKSDAAKEAAGQQQQGSEKAAGYVQQGMNQLGSIYAPYLNSAQSAMNTRARLTTPGAGARFASPGPPDRMSQIAPPQLQLPAMPDMSRALGSPGGPALGPRGERDMPANWGVQGFAQGPYPMAKGGDMMVDRPTLFLAGEAGPERATFTPQGRGGPGGPPPPGGPGMGMGGPGMGGPGAPSVYPGSGGPDLSQILLQRYAARDAANQAGQEARAATIRGMTSGGPQRPMGGPPQPPPPRGGGPGGPFAPMQPPPGGGGF